MPISFASRPPRGSTCRRGFISPPRRSPRISGTSRPPRWTGLDEEKHKPDKKQLPQGHPHAVPVREGKHIVLFYEIATSSWLTPEWVQPHTCQVALSKMSPVILRTSSFSLVAARFSEGLQGWRQRSGKTISEAAGEFGVAVSTWGHWETGHSFPSVENLLLLAQYIGVPAQTFLCPNSDKCAFLGARQA